MRIEENISTLIITQESRLLKPKCQQKHQMPKGEVTTSRLRSGAETAPSLRQAYPPASKVRGARFIAPRQSHLLTFNQSYSHVLNVSSENIPNPVRSSWSRNIPVYLVNRSVLRPDAVAFGLAALGLNSAERCSALRLRAER